MASREPLPRTPQDGSAIRVARFARKLTTEQLSKAAGVSSKTISLAERELRPIAFERLERIAKAMRIPVTDLLREPYKTRVSTLDGSNGDGSEAA